ncbi:MAG: hypothetical protein GXO74_08720, partial [Calditrichaeota bacterium]|nr:hypothetical protein [Calditrichota bacterium]
RVGLFFSVAVILILALVIFKFAKQLSIAQQKPEKLEITNSVFFQQTNDPNTGTIMNEADASAPFHSIAAADFNGDHFVDVVFFDKLGYLTIVNGRTKRDLWERGARVRGLANSTIALDDLNENGLNDIVVAGFNTVISAFEGKTGMEFWSSQILGGEFTGTPIVGKLNSDPYPDVFVASRQGVLDIGIGNYGEAAWKSLNLKMNISTPPIAEDVDGDGLPEIFFASETGKIFSAKLTKDSLSVKTIADLSQISDLKKSRIINLFVFADADGDKKTDVLALSDENALIAINMDSGDVVRAKKLPLAADSSQTAVALIHEFGKREMKKIVTATFSEMKCFPLNAIFAGDNADADWTSHLSQGKFLPRQMAVADVDKDKIQDVIVPILPPGIAVISGKTGKALTSYVLKSRDGTFPVGSPVVADFNNDTFIDILQRMSDNSFQLFSTNSRVPGGAVLWGQMKGNSFQNMEAIIRLKPKWFFPATILLAFLLIFVIFAVNFVVIERRRSLFPHEIASE